MQGIKLTEFYLERQGRPDSLISLDMETRQPSIPANYIKNIMLYLGDNYMTSEDIAKLVDPIVTKLHELLIEMEQMKLHLASLSGENISEKDVGN